MVRLCFSDPAISLPQRAEKFVIPTEYVVWASCLRTIDVVGGVIGLWQGVVIAQSWIDGNITHLSFENLVGHCLLVLDICSAQLVVVLPDFSGLAYFLQKSKRKLTSWLTMSPVKIVKLMSSTLKNDGIDLKEDSARSGGESQYKYPNLEAGTEALLTPVCNLVLVE